MALDPEIRALVERVSSRLLEQGAKAVFLTGSHARGRAGAASDIDVFAVGDGPRQRVEVVEGRTVSVHWFTPEDVRQRLASPDTAYLSVAGWRDGIPFDDPTGVGAELQREAEEWTWEKIEAEADVRVAEELVVAAEWARKLVGALEAERELDAAAITADCALRLGHLIAVHRRLMVESENGLWEAIVEAAPPGWGEELSTALRTGGEPLDEAAAGVLRLFEHVAEDVGPLFDDQQRGVVEHALEACREWRAAAGVVED